MQVAMCVPDASLSGTGIQQFGMALGLFPLSLHQTACGRSRQYLAKARHARPISRDYCRDMIAPLLRAGLLSIVMKCFDMIGALCDQPIIHLAAGGTLPAQGPISKPLHSHKP